MDALRDEVESLEAILMDDVKITRNAQSDIPELIETTVFPQVGDDTEQYVCVTLQVWPPPGYPDVSPDFKLVRPRGLDDARLESIRRACTDKLTESLGFPVVFDLIEVVREHLTGSNMPSGQCVVCLYGFSEGDEFTRTECFHYLHSYCLGRHLNALRRNYQEEFDKLPAWLQKTADPFQAACPVCREPIKDEADSLKCAMPPAELENAPEFKLTRELRELQQHMSSLFLQQKSRGAIIDVEAESGAVISIETEEEMRRRTQSKQQNQEFAEQVNADSNSAESSSRNSSTATPETANHKDATCSKSQTGANFAPMVQPTQRTASDPTNNNYQHHNRRHHRGGRRHQQHHHHHHREREREHHHHHHNNAGGAQGSGSAAGSNSNAGGASTGSGAGAGGKQTKAQMAGSVHNR